MKIVERSDLDGIHFDVIEAEEDGIPVVYLRFRFFSHKRVIQFISKLKNFLMDGD